MQAGNSIGGAVSPDAAGRGAELPARRRQGVRREDARAGRRHPGRICPTSFARGRPGRRPAGQRFVFALFDADQIWSPTWPTRKAPKLTKFENIGRQPHDAPGDARRTPLFAGLFGEDGLRCSTCGPRTAVRRILAGYGAARSRCRCSRCRTCAAGGGRATPTRPRSAATGAGGRHRDWREVGRDSRRRPAGVRDGAPRRAPGVGQLRRARLRPRAGDRHPHAPGDRTLEPGKAVLHMEFTPRGEAVWISSRDANRVSVFDTPASVDAGRAAARATPRRVLHQPRRAWGSEHGSRLIFSTTRWQHGRSARAGPSRSHRRGARR